MIQSNGNATKKNVQIFIVVKNIGAEEAIEFALMKPQRHVDGNPRIRLPAYGKIPSDFKALCETVTLKHVTS